MLQKTVQLIYKAGEVVELNKQSKIVKLLDTFDAKWDCPCLESLQKAEAILI